MYSRDLKKISCRQEGVLVRLTVGWRPIEIAKTMGMHPDSVSRIAGTARGRERLRELQDRFRYLLIQATATARLIKALRQAMNGT